MRVLGIDPGTARAGWGVVEQIRGKVTSIGFNCITTDKNETAEVRLQTLFTKVQELIDAYNPDAMSIEELFHATNSKTVIAVAQARGVILLAASLKNLPIYAYSPPAIKRTVTGNGNADKVQVGKMIKMILSLQAVPQLDDTADALAIALTHIYTYKMKGLTS